jgi:hypothetical protein
VKERQKMKRRASGSFFHSVAPTMIGKKYYVA